MNEQTPHTPPSSQLPVQNTPAPRAQFSQPPPTPLFTSFSQPPNQPYFTTPRPPPSQRQIINSENAQNNFSSEIPNNVNSNLQTVPMTPIVETKELEVQNTTIESNSNLPSSSENSNDQLTQNENNNSSNSNDINNNFPNSYDQRMMQLEYELQQTRNALQESNAHRAQLECQQAYIMQPQHYQLNQSQNQNLNLNNSISNIRPSDVAKLLAKPKHFNGDSRIIDEWIFSMRNYLFLSGTPPELQVPISGGYLEGSALQWLTHLRVNERHTLVNFEALVVLLLKQFRPLDYEADAWSRLSKLTQTGTISAFNTLFDSITQRLPKLDKSEAVRHYREKLKIELQKQLAGFEYDNITAIQKAAIRFEALLKLNAPRTLQYSRPSYPNRSTSAPTVAAVHNVQVSQFVQEEDEEDCSSAVDVHLNSMSVPKMTPEIREQCRRLKLCFRCRTAGHLSAACPKFTSSNRSMKPSNPISKKNFQ